ncbi:MAG: DUF1641 domain-containing protein [Halobacteriota archaeon]
MGEEKMEKGKEAIALGLEPADYDALVEVLTVVRFLRDYMNDQMLHDISEIMCVLFKLTDAMAGSGLIDIMNRGLQDPELDKVLLNPPELGTWRLIGAMKDEEVRKGMGIMMALLKAIGKAATA